MTSFGSLLTAIISHNNFIARGERLDALEFQYKNATTWEIAELNYDEMKYTHNQLRRDRQRRDLFFIVTAALWTLNIVDVLYNTDDRGESLFSLHSGNEHARTHLSFDSPHKPLLSLSLPLK
ncbi:MAG: hypothetical protein HYV29_02495 [Ignavibacteriales bacterium]|nr:hypothetical protein [Ignavibacteriales bacterium]